MATYAIIGIIFIALAIVASKQLKLRNKRAAIVAFVVVAIMTLHFEPIMIQLGLYQHDATKLLGPEIRTIPIEDFLYVLFAAIVVPSLWDWYGKTERTKLHE